MSEHNCSMFVRRMQEKNASPMPIIGLYVAAASITCSIAMSLSSFVILIKWLSKLYVLFSTKIFVLNATWLTLLAVATKLTGDLTTPMWSPYDNIVKISSAVFLTFAMANFVTLLSSMTNTDMLTNLTALSILVITVLVDLCIQLSTGAIDFSLFPEIIFAIALLFCMFVTVVCSALAIPAIKKDAESKCQKLASQMEAGPQCHTVDELRLSITKYWVMAASGSPEFLMKRLATSFFRSIICLFSAIISYLPYFRPIFKDYYKLSCHKQSDYKWSVLWICVAQLLAMVTSVITSTVYLISLAHYKYEENGIKIYRQEFTIETYWTEILVEWRQGPIHMRIVRGKAKRFLHGIKSLVLTFCIVLQIMVVMCMKFSCVISFYICFPFAFLIYHLGKLLPMPEISNEQREETDLNRFVILLEGQNQLPKRILRRMVNTVDFHIKLGKWHQPLNLFNLLNQRLSCRGVIEFDSNQVPSLLFEELPNCWILPVVTLTSIVIALPDIASQHVDELVSGVDEGLRYASLIDVLDEKYGLKRIKNAAEIVWVRVSLHKKWLDMNLEEKIGKESSAREIIQTLADEAERIVKEYISTNSTTLLENSLYWPANVLAANSMYRISRTILLYYENGECHAEEVFKKLICMIADILAACLTNLPHLIATKCKCNSIEKLYESVRHAAILFGEIEEILKFFEGSQLLGNRPTQPLCIDEWRKWMERQNPTVSTSAISSNGTPFTECNENVVVEIPA